MPDTDKLDKAVQDLLKYSTRRFEANERGKQLSKQIPDGARGYADTVANLLYHHRPDDKEMQLLLLDWTMERFWGMVVETCIPFFDESWKWLDAHGASEDNCLVWGDADDGAWVVPHKSEFDYETVKVIVHESYCTCRDVNKIFLMQVTSPFGVKLHVRDFTGDNPFVDNMRYKDCRDTGYCLSYKKDKPFQEGAHTFSEVDRPLTFIADINYAVQVLHSLAYGIHNPLEVPKKK